MLQSGLTTIMVTFAKGKQVAIEIRRPFDKPASPYYRPTRPLYVRAIEDIPHGDYKTQMSRKEFMGVRKNQMGEIIMIWENLEGLQFTVEHSDGQTTDCQTRYLEVISKEEFEFGAVPATFLYRTNSTKIPQFTYDKHVSAGDILRLEEAHDTTVVLKVLNVAHVIRKIGSDFTPIQISLTVEEQEQ